MLNSILIFAILAQCPVTPDAPLITPGGLSGTAVSMHNDLAVIGAPLGTGNEWASGIVLVYRLVDGLWTKEAELTASDTDAGDMMGISVDVYDNKIIAGAWFEDHAGSNSGAAYIFEYDEEQWIQKAKLTAFDASAEDSFGRQVVINGDICVISSPLDDDNGSSSGSAYVFQRQISSESWIFTQKLKADNGHADDQFGLSLSITNDILLVGAPWANVGAGQVHIFNRAGSSYSEYQVLDDPNGSPYDNFGFGVDIKRPWMAIGSYHDSDIANDAGSVFIFTSAPDGNWILNEKIYSNNPSIGEQFGVSVAVNENVLLVGHRFGVFNKRNTGTASIFDFENESWNHRSNLLPDSASNNAEFGWCVALEEDHSIIGGPWHEPDGYAEIFSGMIYNCQCDGDINYDNLVNITDLLEVISDWGTTKTPSDINNDGIVDVSDLLIVVDNWGPCE